MFRYAKPNLVHVRARRQNSGFKTPVEKQSNRTAPVVAYTRKDTLQSSFLQEALGLPEGAYPCHYVPGATSHFNAIRYGLGYGMVPELLLKANTDGELVEMLTPKTPADVALYWHTWKVQSPRMEQLSRQIIAAARSMLK